MESLREEIRSNRMSKERVCLRGLQLWPRFTGVMIDGDAEGEIPVPNEGTHGLDSLVIRVQAAIPPDRAASQHFAPIFEFRRPLPSASMLAFVRGFRFAWQTAKPLPL